MKQEEQPKKGKNYSRNNASGNRIKDDDYPTPYSMVWQLLERETFPKRILEPAAGPLRAMVTVLGDYGYEVTSRDISEGFDFTEHQIEQHPAIITNPPYKFSLQFLLRAKQVATEKIALLLPLTYLYGQERYDLVFSDRKFPLDKVLVFTRAPMLGLPLREDGKYPTGMQVYAWFIWTKGKRGAPTIGHIDNRKYVLSKKDA